MSDLYTYVYSIYIYIYIWGKIYFHRLKTAKKGGKRGEKALKAKIFTKIGRKGHQSTAKVKPRRLAPSSAHSGN